MRINVQQGREEDGKIGASSGRYLPICFPLYSFLVSHNNKNNLLFWAILHSASLYLSFSCLPLKEHNFYRGAQRFNENIMFRGPVKLLSSFLEGGKGEAGLAAKLKEVGGWRVREGFQKTKWKVEMECWWMDCNNITSSSESHFTRYLQYHEQ